MQKQGEIQKGTVRKDHGSKEKKNATEGKDKDTDEKQKEAVQVRYNLHTQSGAMERTMKKI